MGHTEIVRLLIDLPLNRGVDPGARDKKAFRTACERCHTEIVRLLFDLPLNRGVNPAARDNEALRSACANGHTEIVRMLLDLPLDRGVATMKHLGLHASWDILTMPVCSLSCR